MEQLKQEVCTIRIAFPVVSDDAAIKIKKAIETILTDIADAQIQFSIMNVNPKTITG